ncbi:MAG TPA: radical SAM protein, partial [Terriglobales bacterium]|nr:radical SAM protein [Terriglobales bacterium]
MRVVFLGTGAEQLPVELLSAILKQHGHHVGLVFDGALFNDSYHLEMPWLANLFRSEESLIEDAVAMRPDVIAMSVLTNTYRWGLKMAAAIKARTGAKVLFGGVHPSAVPDAVIAEPTIDAICIGEGDFTLPAYLRALETDTLDTPIDNLWHKRADGTILKGRQSGFLQDLDSLPFPDKDLYADEIRIQDCYLTITGRGCPYRCTFCFNSFWANLPMRSGDKGGKYVRQRSVDNVIAELRHAKQRWGIRYVDLEDDILTVDKDWIRRFSEAYRQEIRLPFKCLTHPKYVDEDVVRWLKEAGCTWVQIGIQSIDDHYKYKELKRYEKVGDVAWAIDAFNKVGISAKGDHIFGNPGERLESQEVARHFYAAHTPARISTFWLTYFPGLEMTEAAVARGDLSSEDVARLARGEVAFFQKIDQKLPPLEQRALLNYKSLFKILPAVPRRWRDSVKAEWLTPIPGAA